MCTPTNVIHCNKSSLLHQFFTSKGSLHDKHTDSDFLRKLNKLSPCLSSTCKCVVSLLTANLVPHKPNGAGWIFVMVFTEVLRCLCNFCPKDFFTGLFSASWSEHHHFHIPHASNRICCLTYRWFTLVTACTRTFSQPVIIVTGRQSSFWKSSEGTEMRSLKNQSL